MSDTHKLPVGVRRVLMLLKAGHTLHSSFLGMWTCDPTTSRCRNVNHHTARSLINRKLILATSRNTRLNVSAWQLNTPDVAHHPKRGE